MSLDFGLRTSDFRLFLNPEQRLTVLYRLAVLNINFRDLAHCFRLYLIHQLHRFNDTDYRVVVNGASEADERIRLRRRRAIKSADNR